MTEPAHKTVLLAEVTSLVAPRDGGLYADVTLGRGGHAEAVLDASAPGGRLVGVDRDPTAIASSRERLARFGDRVELHQAPLSSLESLLAGQLLDGLVADLGVSSPQLDDAARGMSFRAEGPLDMRMGDDAATTAWQLVRDLRDTELADVIYEYGEERASRPIARSIKRAIERGEMETTLHLASAVYRVLGPPRHGRIDPATRTFQALRIAVNDELGELDRLLALLPRVLADGGVAAIISFHSLEDRKVKHAFRGDAALEPLVKKPVEAGEAECAENPRARSAKLRAARRVPRGEEGEGR
ncbi:MAG: 16S rRNA (cytosine(1402)-N(4))-methyltransferase RsmH [Polyangiales bacterium]